MRNAGFGKSFNYGQNVENWDLPVKQDGRLRAKREKQGFSRKMSLQTKRTSAIIAPVFGAGTFSLRFAVFSILMRLTKKDDDCRITFVFCLTWLTFVAYHEFYA
ncbi:hypothetical protein [Ligilactobacillus ruminis]|nr:hypothetical protein [Ligilactobacillus ruminis]